MENTNSNQKPSELYTTARRNRFFLKIKGDGKEIKECQVSSFGEDTEKKELKVGYINCIGADHCTEDFFLKRITRKPKWMTPKKKKLHIEVGYLDDEMRCLRSCYYSNVVVREVSTTDFDYSLNGYHKVFATLEYGKKDVMIWDVPIDTHVDLPLCALDEDVKYAPKKSKRRRDINPNDKEYADKVMEAQQNMLRDARDNVYTYGKANNWTPEKIEQSANFVDKCIKENHLETEKMNTVLGNTTTASEMSRGLLYETRTKILENAKKEKWSPDEINHAIKMIDRLLTKSYKSEDFDITIDLKNDGNEEDT
ncbi:MAG: hypothetical protein LUD72_06315, partial [Bacteroidales bacterium]|nr:hypothetical protein [Bacteroidales bacterium]